jgi:hypothetical protein
MAPVKRIVAFLLMFAFVCSLGLSTTGCGKKDADKKDTKADTKAADKKDDKKP